jgi:hypothetical protein
MRLAALVLAFASTSTFAQTAQVFECAHYSHEIDAYIALSDDVVHNHIEGVRAGNTMQFSEGQRIRNQVWQDTMADRNAIQSIAYLGDVPNCARLAADAKAKIDAILEENGLQAHEVGG